MLTGPDASQLVDEPHVGLEGKRHRKTKEREGLIYVRELVTMTDWLRAAACRLRD
jgi:hypothetical protein